MLSLNFREETGMEKVNLRECPEKIMELVLVAPRSINKTGEGVSSSFSKDLAIDEDSISRAKGFNPAALRHST